MEQNLKPFLLYLDIYPKSQTQYFSLSIVCCLMLHRRTTAGLMLLCCRQTLLPLPGRFISSVSHRRPVQHFAALFLSLLLCGCCCSCSMLLCITPPVHRWQTCVAPRTTVIRRSYAPFFCPCSVEQRSIITSSSCFWFLFVNLAQVVIVCCCCCAGVVVVGSL